VIAAQPALTRYRRVLFFPRAPAIPALVHLPIFTLAEKSVSSRLRAFGITASRDVGERRRSAFTRRISLMFDSTWGLPLTIFAAELCVVTLGTLRIIFVSRGNRYLAPAIGFFEVSTWLFAIGKVMSNLNDMSCFLAFATGFSAGNYLGILIEKKLAMGLAIVRVFAPGDSTSLALALRERNFGVTSVEGQGARGRVDVVLTIVKRRQLDEVLGMVETLHPGAFYAVDDLQAASAGIFPLHQPQNHIPAILRDFGKPGRRVDRREKTAVSA